MEPSLRKEWLEADGLGGYASGSAAGIRTRRYHALLLVATTPPTGRMVLVNGFDAWVTTPAGRFPISSQAYLPDVIHPDGMHRIAGFEVDPWPCWRFQLEDGTALEQEIFVAVGSVYTTIVAWRLSRPASGVTLAVRPFLSGRNQHALHRENSNFRFDAAVSGGEVRWQPYPDVPGVSVETNGTYTHHPDWYRNFLYAEEQARGLDFVEDLASPGIFSWDLSHGEALWILRAAPASGAAPYASELVTNIATRWRAAERLRRAALCTPQVQRRGAVKSASGARARLLRSASAYRVQRGAGQTVIAGYPWFTDWGRDTFIALRGLCLATGRLDEARSILVQWAATVSNGMLPNRFPEAGENPEYNSVDASLWFIVAVHDFFAATKASRRPLAAAVRSTLHAAIDAILDGYQNGTRYNIWCDADGLLAAGEPGMQLTWMDARVGDRVITPRIGKPVEIQALWLNALKIASAAPGQQTPAQTPAATREAQFRRGLQAFEERFWNDSDGCLYDVIDVDHHRGAVDASFRPNQILAIGGLPFQLLRGARALAVVDAVQARLLTPMGLRSLAPGDPRYAAHYVGGASERDAAYHQGTVWPWLIGPFIEAWVRVRGDTAAAKREARDCLLAPLLEHLDDAGLGHVPEIADGDAPYAARGCPFQAWSVGEALRLELTVLAE